MPCRHVPKALVSPFALRVVREGAEWARFLGDVAGFVARRFDERSEI